MRHCLLLISIGAVGLTAVPAVAGTPAPPRLTVLPFQSAEQGLGAHAADVLLHRLAHDFSAEQLVLIPTDVVNSVLQQSGFAPNKPLDARNAQRLAQLVQAEYYLTGTMRHTQDGYHLFPQLVLAQDTSLTQPLPPASGPTLDAAVASVSQALKAALKQMNAEDRCIAAARAGKAQEAIAAAQQGVAAYPQATFVRRCALDVYWTMLYPRATTRADSLRYADSALARARALVAIDSTSIKPLTVEAALYPVTGDTAQARVALLSLVRADPHNTTLLNQVINSLAASHDTADAVQLVGTLLDQSPNDPQVLRTAFLVDLTAQRWSSVTALGPRLITADTAAADSAYFVRMATAYQAQNDVPHAIVVVRQGTTKFPTKAALWQLAVQLDLTNHQPDSAYAALQQAAAVPGIEKPVLAQTALGAGGHLYKEATASRNRADYQQALRFLQLSNQLEPSIDAQFLGAATSFAIMQDAAQEAKDTKSCSLAHLAQQAAGDVEGGLTAGAHDPKYQASATQMQHALPQLRSAVDAEVTQFCH